ncbi:cbb3-type cytochrome oxidase assembly protein CcoS [Thalassomonas sp. M1454]|uniref:cbb3-type cytochrome oxidase assembly protein CcoS n=1 Tax=Thalassomonas sp. M1454 TaxID=2594477 RepID=UPI00117D68A6|nr:cbb3-type cytochrome oxidase assembly protein CcoS [Thalassomonas sp. M1454]TRX56962.1 cbb3-type cytochrome oxidase assembly protein CcoS [Thalassomonas sp. M1454]
MSVIYILIPIAIVFTSVAIYLFFWAVKTEQFDDLEKQGMSILFDDEAKSPTTDAQASEQQAKQNSDQSSNIEQQQNKSAD